MAAPRRRLTFGADRLAAVSTAISKPTSAASKPLPEWVKKIQEQYQRSKQQYQQLTADEDTEMTDSVQTRVDRIDQEIQNLVNCCNSEKRVIEEEFDDVRRDCEIFAQQVETNRALGTQVLEGHEQQIRVLDFVIKETRTGIDAIQEQSQQIIAGATDEFNRLKIRIEDCEKEQAQLKIKQASLTTSYTILHRRLSDLEKHTKTNVPDYSDFQKMTERIEDIAEDWWNQGEEVSE